MASAPQSRYPHPKSLPSGEGLTIALTGSNVHIDIHENPESLENFEKIKRSCENLEQKKQRPRNNKSEAVIKINIPEEFAMDFRG